MSKNQNKVTVKIVKPESGAIQTRAELEETMRLFVEETISRNNLVSDLDKKLTEARAAYETSIAEAQAELDRLQGLVQDWAMRNKKTEFSMRKTMELTHGKIGFRDNPPEVAKAAKTKWEDVVKALKDMPTLAGYVRTVEELDKKAIISDREKIDAGALKQAGAWVRQTESFSIEPKLTVVENSTKVEAA